MLYENLTADFINLNSIFVVADIEGEEALLSEVFAYEEGLSAELYRGENVVNSRFAEILETSIEVIEGDVINLREITFDDKRYLIAYFSEFVKDENGEEIFFDEDGEEGEIDLFNAKIFEIFA